MGLINWIFDIYQHTQIDKARDAALEARAAAASIRSSGNTVDVERLERALGELALATKTIQRLPGREAGLLARGVRRQGAPDRPRGRQRRRPEPDPRLTPGG